MTLEQIIALLTAKFAGVRKDGLAQIARTIMLQATTEEEAQAVIDKLDESKVKAAVTEFRKDVDKEVSESNKTFEGNLKKKYKFVPVDGSDPGKDPDPNKVTDPNDVAAIVKAAVAEAVKPFQEKLSGFEGQQVSKTRLQQLQGIFKEDTPESYKTKVLKDFGRMAFDTDDTFNEYLTETQSDLDAFNQELANNGLSQQGKPAFNQTRNKDGVSSGVAEYIADQKASQESLGGKEV